MHLLLLYISSIHSYSGGYTEDFKDLTGSGGHLRDFAMDMLDSEMVINDKENSCGLED